MSLSKTPSKVFSVVGDKRTGTEVIHNIARRGGRYVTTTLLSEVERFNQPGGIRTVRFVLVMSSELPTSDAPMEEAFKEAKRRRYIPPSIKQGLLLAEKYTQAELGVDSVMVCHVPEIILPRRNNASRTRVHRLFLGANDRGDTLGITRCHHQPGWSIPIDAYAFCLPEST